MADWFKFYENGLDEPLFQFAVGTLSEVTPVWVGILSECCRHKCQTISWDDGEAYLFGFSRRLNVSIPKVNEAINMLARIKYISIENGKLTVLNWNEFQSEYMKRKYRSNPKRVRTQSEHNPNTVRREERRVEKSRVEKKITSAAPASGEHQAFIKGWMDNFKAQFHLDYSFDGGRDGKAVKHLLSLNIQTIDLLEISKKAWSSQSQNFDTQQAITISGFASRINQLKVLLISKEKNKDEPMTKEEEKDYMRQVTD